MSEVVDSVWFETCLYIFSKGEQSDLSPEQKRIIAALSKQIKKEQDGDESSKESEGADE